MADHKIVVTRDGPGLALLATLRPVTEQDRADHHTWRVVCSDPAGCPGWVECREAHEVDGRSAADGPWEADEDDPWAEQDEFVFHGVAHEWRYGHGWTVDYAGCPVEGSDAELPDGIDTTVDGEYLVEVEWDDEFCVLTLVEAGADR